MDVRAHNRAAWNREVDHQNPWTVPVSPEMIAAARRGDWSILLTGTKPVPRSWFPDLVGCTVLCLASGGGQQGPMLAAAGAQVTVFDNSPRQLAQDRLVADRDGLTLTTVEGDMADLSVFPDASFELVFHPVSNLFVPDVRPVWAEVFRVLRRGGLLLAGFLNPVEYVFDRALADQGVFQVRFGLPYSDLTSLAEEERAQTYGADAPVEFSHTLDDQIGGQLAAGLHLTGFYEDYRQDAPIAAYMPSYIATRAIKP
jgi:SAM-dependent methyltransferase